VYYLSLLTENVTQQHRGEKLLSQINAELHL